MSVTKRRPRYGWYGQSQSQTIEVGARVRYTVSGIGPNYTVCTNETGIVIRPSKLAKGSLGRDSLVWIVKLDKNGHEVDLAEWTLEIIPDGA